ncbi:MAG: hypothetical protein ACRBDL_01085 [Alphaproteobacteria bacterium]
MSFLDEISVDQRRLLVSLPYRVGLYVSQSDETGGDESDDLEMAALDSIVTAYAQEVFGAETVQYVIGETVARKAEWKGWSDNLSGIHEDCHRAIDILSDVVDDKEISAFKRHLLEIGESVALAFREYGEKTPFLTKVKMYLYYLKGKKHARKYDYIYKDWEQFINISLDERKALEGVASALNMKYV